MLGHSLSLWLAKYGEGRELKWPAALPLIYWKPSVTPASPRQR